METLDLDLTYPILRNKPVAKFSYKGTHSKPVRRTVLLTALERNVITGYEVREGNEVRDPCESVIKSFSRDSIQDLRRFSAAAIETGRVGW